VIVLGAILLILGYVFPAFHILWVIGVILLVVGAVMWVMARWVAQSAAGGIITKRHSV